MWFSSIYIHAQKKIILNLERKADKLLFASFKEVKFTNEDSWLGMVPVSALELRSRFTNAVLFFSPVAGLCSTSYIFERLILGNIMKLEIWWSLKF